MPIKITTTTSLLTWHIEVLWSLSLPLWLPLTAHLPNYIRVPAARGLHFPARSAIQFSSHAQSIHPLEISNHGTQCWYLMCFTLYLISHVPYECLANILYLVIIVELRYVAKIYY